MTTAFDETDCDVMSRALERSWIELFGSGMAQCSESVAKAALGHAIIEIADTGERREELLVAYALAHFPRSKSITLDRTLGLVHS